MLYTLRAGAFAGYVGAVREIGVVLGAGIGVLWLNEPGTITRLLGAALVAAGVVVIKLLG